MITQHRVSNTTLRINPRWVQPSHCWYARVQMQLFLMCAPNSVSQHVYISLAFAVKAQFRKYLSVHLSREIWSLNCKYSFPFETCSSPGSCRFLWFHTFRAKRWWCVYNSFITADCWCRLKRRQPEQQCYTHQLLLQSGAASSIM